MLLKSKNKQNRVNEPYINTKIKIKVLIRLFRVYYNVLNENEEEEDVISTARIQIQNVFLTYSKTHASVTRDYILKALQDKINFKKYVIAKEYHKDNNIHFHVVISFPNQLNKAMNFFDIEVPSVENPYHPNVKYAKPLAQKVLYCVKEDKEYLVKGFNIEKLRKQEEQRKRGDILMQSIKVLDEEGYNKALDFFLATANPRQKAKYTSRVANTLKALNTMKNRLTLPKAKYKLEAFYKLSGIENFIKAFSKDSGHGAMYIGGITGIGKTHYFEALLTELKLRWITVATFEQLKNYDLHAIDFIIFDDVNLSRFKDHDDFLKLFEHLKATPIPCRHFDPIIPAGVGRIFLSNFSFFDILEQKGLADDLALIRRVYDCVIVHYLSPKIPVIKKSKAIEYQPQININIINSTITGNLQFNSRDFNIPEYKSIENRIILIPNFAGEIKDNIIKTIEE